MARLTTTRISVTLVLMFLPAFLLAHPLWREAVGALQESEGLVPGSMSMRFDQYNGRGDLISSDETLVRLWIDANGEVQSTIVLARSNGEDVTEQRRGDPGAGSRMFGPGAGDDGDGSPFASLQRSPFAVEEQPRVTIIAVGPAQSLDGRTVLPLEFEHRTAPDVLSRGTAWLDAESGTPVRLESTFEPLPRFVSTLRMVQHYARDNDGNLIVERLEFSGDGRFLLFRRRLESVLFFSEYFRLP